MATTLTFCPGVCQSITSHVVGGEFNRKGFCLKCGTVSYVLSKKVLNTGPVTVNTQLQHLKETRRVPDKLLSFVTAMALELETNQHKGQWEEYTNLEDIAKELDKHHVKLMAALDSNDLPRILEHTADCANYYLFIANSRKVLG